MSRRSPFVLLYLARVKEFIREPEVLFWVFGFPILLAVGLGIAFRNKPADRFAVGIVPGPGAQDTLRALTGVAALDASLVAAERADESLRLGRIALLIEPGASPEIRYDPTRPESAMARGIVLDALQRAAGRVDPLAVQERQVTEPGARYIDFLIPGLLGMNVMSGGMWGVGFVLVEMRSRKLLKRLVATPMRRTDFLGAMMASRMTMVALELVLLLVFGWLVFDMRIRGSLIAMLALTLLGGFTFCGLGLLVASRARKIETVSGLMNLVMLPMFVASGIFFSAERFPAAVLPFVRALPLTALNDALRAVILEGASLPSQWARLMILATWGGLSFIAALRLFRWN